VVHQVQQWLLQPLWHLFSTGMWISAARKAQEMHGTSVHAA
jgi:hypothetical protein